MSTVQEKSASKAMSNAESDSELENSTKKHKKLKKDKKKENISETANNVIKKRKKGPRVSLKTLTQKKAYLQALGDLGCQDTQLQIMENMKSNDFKLLCNCIHDFSLNPNITDHFFSSPEFDVVGDVYSQWKDSLRKLANPELDVKTKQKLLRKTQKGGSVMLAAVVGSLVPLAVDAIEKYIWPKK